MTGKTSKTLKAENKPVLLAVLAANVAIYWAIISATSFDGDGFAALAKQGWVLIPTALSGGVMVILVGMISNDWKYRLIYWRWHHPLPGSRAFTQYAISDPRVDATLLEKKLGRMPSEPKEQNTTWYKLFKSLERVPEIAESHRDSLLTRDWTSFSAVVLAISPSALFFAHLQFLAIAYIGAAILQYLTVRLAAQNNGVKLVVNVLALVTSKAT